MGSQRVRPNWVTELNWTTAVTVESNKIVSNEVRQLSASRTILWKNMNEPFGQLSIYDVMYCWCLNPFIITSWLSLFLVTICSKVYFVGHKYNYICFLLIIICMEYHLQSLRFESVCIFRTETSILKTPYSSVLFFNPSRHSVPFDWWVQSIYISDDCWYVRIYCCKFIFCFLFVPYLHCFFFLVFLSYFVNQWFSVVACWVFLFMFTICVLDFCFLSIRGFA